MASAVSICNLALSHIGDRANVQSISPPDASIQAEKCAQFYPIARDVLLEGHAWSFNTTRRTLAEVPNPLASWAFAYAMPPGCVKPLAVLPPETTDDSLTQPFIHESDEDGNAVLYTNQEAAVLKYQIRVADTTKFSPLFVTCLSWLLASYLAGPILKGKTGAAAARNALERFGVEFASATASNANASNEDTYRRHKPQWIADR